MMITKGVVLAGGTGSRLAPATNVTNKHLLPVGSDPMIYYPIRSLMREGVTKILVTLGGNAVGDIVRVLSDEPEFRSVDLVFKYQRQAGGIAEALALASDFIGDDRFCVLLGDNILLGGLGDAFAEFAGDQDAKAMVFLKEVPDPHRFGVAVVEDGAITQVLEKPEQPPSPLAIIGVYLYTSDVFTVAKGLARSARGELEISDVQSHYMATGELRHRIINNDWTDAGTPYSLARANVAVMPAEQRRRIYDDLEFGKD